MNNKLKNYNKKSHFINFDGEKNHENKLDYFSILDRSRIRIRYFTKRIRWSRSKTKGNKSTTLV